MKKSAPPRAVPASVQALIAIVAASAALSMCWAEIGVEPRLDVREQNTFYEVEGSTATAIATSMREHGPTVDDRRWHGLHDWHIRWSFGHYEHMGLCRLSRLVVRLDTKIVLPRWSPPRDAPRQLVRAWNGYVEALHRHEEGHREIAVEAASEVLRSLSELRTPDCSTIASEANTLGDAILVDHGIKSEEFDRASDHGRHDGAVWPPPSHVE